VNTVVPFGANPDLSLSVLGDQPYPSFELRNIVRYLDQSPFHNSTELLAHVGVNKDQLEEAFLPAFKVLGALKYCSNHLGPVAGAQIGSTYKVNDLGVFGYAVASSQTIEQALELADKYNSLIGNLLKREAQIKGDQFVVKFYNIQHLDKETLSFFVALSLSARIYIARSIFGDDLNYASVALTFNDEKNRDLYQKLYGCPVEFNADFNGYSLYTKNLERRIKDGNHASETQYLPYCNELLGTLKQKDSMVNDIQQILVSCAGDYPDIEMLASAFNISSRTLRRQLANLGTSYQKILNKVRCQLSIEYLTRTQISIEDISNLIGFSDVTNFRHAFKKWVGKTPSFYRKNYQN
jgi:AraC-like DNA-binding protein